MIAVIIDGEPHLARDCYGTTWCERVTFVPEQTVTEEVPRKEVCPACKYERSVAHSG